jgi:hypothetical protein
MNPPDSLNTNSLAAVPHLTRIRLRLDGANPATTFVRAV